MISGLNLIDLANQVFRPCNPDLIGINSIDVTLGDTLYRPTSAYTRQELDLSNLPDEDELYNKYSFDGAGFTLAPGSFCKAITAEKFTMPHHVTGMFSLRSCIAQAGLEQSTSVWIRPGWEGHLILELSNFTNKDLILRAGLRIGQVHFFNLIDRSPF